MKKLLVLSLSLVLFFCGNASAQTTDNASTTFTIADSANYIGKYKYEGLPFEYMEVYVKDGKLSYLGGQYSGILEASKDAKDVFYATDDAVFTFQRNKENKVTELRIDYMGQTFFGNREAKKD